MEFVMDISKLILFLLHAASLGCAQTVEYYPESLTIGEPAVISCSDPAKPLGSPQWDYGDNNKQYTSLCQVVEDDGTLEERDDCYGDAGIGFPANFTFTIRNVSWQDIGSNKWKCLMYTTHKELIIPCESVEGPITSVEYTGDRVLIRKTDIEVSATTSCHYPVEKEIIWCIKRSDEEEIKCSDTGDDENLFYKDIFEDVTIGPVTNTTCVDITDCPVQKVSSIFRGTTAKKRMKNVFASLFVKVQGSYYEVNAISIDVESFTGGEIGGMAVGGAAGSATVIVCAVIFWKKKKKKDISTNNKQ